MNEFEERKQKKERGITVKETLNQALDIADDIETIVIVYKKKDGTVPTSFNWENSLEALGMLEIGKADIISYLET
ncbi:MAG: hypothetical protein L0J63_01155 [Tetragenococcus koreensis]|nr:hypothetical protein [Tetragenococcus koreensis]